MLEVKEASRQKVEIGDPPVSSSSSIRSDSVAVYGRTKLAVEWIERGDTLLDVGCSDGLLVSSAYPKCRGAVGLDVDQEMLRRARERCPEAEFCFGSADDLPFEDASFSVVSMMDALEHVPDPEASLREIDRVLGAQGRLILSVPHKGTFGSIDVQNSVLFAAGRKVLLGKTDKVAGHRHFSLDELLSMIGSRYVVKRLHMGGYLVFPLCGYVLMLTDNMNIAMISRAVRRLEEWDFQRDYGKRSWHLMAEFEKKSPAGD